MGDSSFGCHNLQSWRLPYQHFNIYMQKYLVVRNILGHATGTETVVVNSYNYQGVPECAIMKEASIAGLTHLANKRCLEEGIFDDMADIVKELAPTMKAVAPKVLSVIAEPLLRIAIDRLDKVQENGGTEAGFDPPAIRGRCENETDTKGFGPQLYQNQQHFVDRLTQRVQEVEDKKDGAFSSFLGTESTIGDVVSKGLRNSVPLSGSATHSGLQRLTTGTETDMTGKFPFDGLAERSLVGEAALRALTSLDTARQDKLAEEGLFDAMVDAIAKYGPVVLKTAPAIIDGLQPLVDGLRTENLPQFPPPGSTEFYLPEGANENTWPRMTLQEARETSISRNFEADVKLLFNDTEALVAIQTPGRAQRLAANTVGFLGTWYSSNLGGLPLPSAWEHVFDSTELNAVLGGPLPTEGWATWVFRCVHANNGVQVVNRGVNDWIVRLSHPEGRVVDIPGWKYLSVLSEMLDSFTERTYPSEVYSFPDPAQRWWPKVFKWPGY